MWELTTSGGLSVLYFIAGPLSSLLLIHPMIASASPQRLRRGRTRAPCSSRGRRAGSEGGRREPDARCVRRLAARRRKLPHPPPPPPGSPPPLPGRTLPPPPSLALRPPGEPPPRGRPQPDLEAAGRSRGAGALPAPASGSPSTEREFSGPA